jgi:flagellar motor switch protein FliN
VTTEAPVSADPQTLQLQRVWLACLQGVVGQVAGFPVTVEPCSEEEPAPKPAVPEKPPVCVVITASKALQGDMAVVVSEAGALALSQLLMSEQLNGAVPFDQEHRDGFEELLRQVLGQVASSLTQTAGGEVEVKPSASELPAWAGAGSAKIRIAGEKLQPVLLTLIVSTELGKSLEAHPNKEPSVEEPSLEKAEAPSAIPPAAQEATPAAAPTASVPASPAMPSSTAPAAPKGEPPPPGGRGSNLELLLDVRLDATIRFGQKTMLLREILELHPGTAVALDRQVEEPVELLVGGKVVAQGEVVIVDGNYGLRITEILSPQQRIESLGKQR